MLQFLKFDVKRMVLAESCERAKPTSLESVLRAQTIIHNSCSTVADLPMALCSRRPATASELLLADLFQTFKRKEPTFMLFRRQLVI